MDSKLGSNLALGTAHYGRGSLVAARIAALAASKITSGSFGAARMPGLGASGWIGSLAAARIVNLPATKIDSGSLGIARIPGLGASGWIGSLAAARVAVLPTTKITTGSFDVQRIPALDNMVGTLPAAQLANLAASKITTGSLAAARLANLAATKITTGSLDAERIANLAASKITTGSLAAARIAALDATKITTGSLATARLPALSAVYVRNPNRDPVKWGIGIDNSYIGIDGIKTDKIRSGLVIVRTGTIKNLRTFVIDDNMNGVAYLQLVKWDDNVVKLSVRIPTNAANSVVSDTTNTYAAGAGERIGLYITTGSATQGSIALGDTVFEVVQ